MKKFLTASVLALALAGCGGGGDSAVAPTPPPSSTPYAPSTIVAWNAVALDVIRSGTLGPPAVARALGMLHTATFDAWAAYDPRAVAVTAGAPARRAAADMTDANKRAAISMAAYRTLLNLYPAQKAKLDAALEKDGLSPSNSGLTDGSPSAVGNAAAAAVIAFRLSDGANQANGYADTTAYAPVNTATEVKDVNYWQPQTFCNGKTPGYLLPHWGNVATFGIANGAALRPARGPAKMGDPKFMQQALDVVALSAGLTEKQKLIAEYWADGPASETPPGHWFLFAQATSKHYQYSLDQDAMLYMALGNAVLDAGVATWDAKRAYNSVRPITAIRTLFKGQTIQAWSKDKGTQPIKGEDWSPFQSCSFITPPFPEYTSGHSAFSTAAAEVLKQFSGSDFNPYSDTIAAGAFKTEANLPAQPYKFTWATFTEAADEAGFSRRYGGIHFEDGDIDARVLGRGVADAAWKKSVIHFNR